MENKEKNFYIYSVNIKSVFKSTSIRDILVSYRINGCLVSLEYIKDEVFIYILDRKIEPEFIFNRYVRPIPLKYHGMISSRKKKRSKNYKHTLYLGFGKNMIVKYYSEGIIKELKRLNLIS